MKFKPQQKVASLPAWRRRLLLLCVLLGFVALVVQSLYLQSANRDFLQKKGGDRYIRTLELQADRGKIKDRNGEILAGSSPVASVWMNPSVVKVNEKNKRSLSALLKIKSAELD